MRILAHDLAFMLAFSCSQVLPAAVIERLPPVPVHWNASDERPPQSATQLAHRSVSDEVSGPFDGYYGYDGKYHHPPVGKLKTFIGGDTRPSPGYGHRRH